VSQDLHASTLRPPEELKKKAKRRGDTARAEEIDEGSASVGTIRGCGDMPEKLERCKNS